MMSLRKFKKKLIHFHDLVEKKFGTRQKYFLLAAAIFPLWFLISLFLTHGQHHWWSKKSFTLAHLDLDLDERISQDEFLRFLRIKDEPPGNLREFSRVTALTRDNQISLNKFVELGLTNGFSRRAEKYYFEKIAPGQSKTIDTDGDGFISTDDWLNLMAILQQQVAFIEDADLVEIFSSMDLNNNGFLTATDFDSGRIFRTMDIDWDHRISFIEFINQKLRGIRVQEKAATLEVYNQRFQKLDTNKDGYITVEEFKNFMNDERQAEQFIRVVTPDQK